MRSPAGRLALVLVVTLLAAACGAADVAQLDGRTFLSTGVEEGGAARALVAGTRIRLDFRDGSSLGISAGCNSTGATYRVDGGILRVESAGSTAMGCDPELHKQDEWLLAFMGSGPAITIDGAGLLLAGGGTLIQLIDREIAEPDLPLVGPVWTVESVVEGDVAMGTGGGVQATLQFADDGRLKVTTDCNDGAGSYAIEGSVIRFSDVAITDMACAGPASMLEPALLRTLGAADGAQVAIDGDALTLSSDALQLVLRGR